MDEKIIKKVKIIIGLNLFMLKDLASIFDKKLYFFLKYMLIFWIIVIVVFYKN